MRETNLGVSKINKLGWGFGLCNMNCEHCYNSSSMACEIPRYTFSELKFVADKVCPFIKDINFGTGEFAINPGTIELVEYIAEHYSSVNMSVTSNGWSIIAIQPSKIKRLFHDIDISIDFPSESRHNNFRRHKKAWKWAIEALSILQDIRVPHSIVSCITSKITNKDIDGLLRLADRFNATWRLSWFRRVGRGCSNLQLTPKRAWDIIFFLSDKVTFQCLDPIFAAPLNLPSTPCPAGNKSVRIHQDMTITPYPFLRGQQWSVGNILNPDVNLQTIYNSTIFKKFRFRQVPECRGCCFWENCRGGCATRAILHGGGINKRDEYCVVATDVNIDRMQIEFQKIDNLIHDGYLCTTICRPR